MLLWLYKGEGLSDTEVAKHLGISRGAVRMRYQRLQQRLQREWLTLA
jgi:DNA-directed RNA polymerase specialized sigma24 family protein